MNKFVLLLVIVQCIGQGVVARPGRRTANAEINKFNTTELLKNIKEIAKEPGKYRRLATLSLLAGAVRTEEKMEQELTKMTNEFVNSFNTSTMADKRKQLKEISRFVQRDLRAMFILNNAIDLSRHNSTFAEFQKSLKSFVVESEQLSPKLERNLLTGDHPTETIRSFIETHVELLRTSLLGRVSVSIDAMQNDQNKKLHMKPIFVEGDEQLNVIPKGGGIVQPNSVKRPFKGTRTVENNGFSENTGAYYVPYQEEIMNHLKHLDRQRRQNEVDDDDEDDLEDFDPNDEAPGGLVGLIANLSGGDEGSDVAAVIGAISGVVTNLFGPGGLDINALLSTGTALIAGLLGGDQNFGKVLAGYVGTSLDGLSGGGGADYNGLFVGNLLGGVIAALSADPEDDDNPPKPGIFLQNVFMGSLQGLRRAGDGQDDAEGGGMAMPAAGGSDVFGFVKGLIKAVIGGITSIVTNTLAGLSSGASKGSGELAMGASGVLSTGSDGVAAMLAA